MSAAVAASESVDAGVGLSKGAVAGHTKKAGCGFECAESSSIHKVNVELVVEKPVNRPVHTPVLKPP